MSDDELATLWIGATRYYLGRMTYAVADYCELLIEQWSLLPESVKKMIKKDVEQEFTLDDAARRFRDENLPLGMDCDRLSWERVRTLWATK